MTISGEDKEGNFKKYKEISDCEYVLAFPSFTTDELYVHCTYNVDAEYRKLHPYAYHKDCTDCTGKDCGKYCKRKRN